MLRRRTLAALVIMRGVIVCTSAACLFGGRWACGACGTRHVCTARSSLATFRWQTARTSQPARSHRISLNMRTRNVHPTTGGGGRMRLSRTAFNIILRGQRQGRIPISSSPRAVRKLSPLGGTRLNKQRVCSTPNDVRQ